MAATFSSISLILVGRLKDRATADLCQKFEGRLKKAINFDLIEVKALNSDNDQYAAKQDQLVLKAISSDAYVILLDEKGAQYPSEKFSQRLSELSRSYKKIVFLIGGALGHGPEVRARANEVLSFGKMTLPHQLARLICLEQLYRAVTISEGHPYHNP